MATLSSASASGFSSSPITSRNISLLAGNRPVVGFSCLWSSLLYFQPVFCSDDTGLSPLLLVNDHRLKKERSFGGLGLTLSEPELESGLVVGGWLRVAVMGRLFSRFRSLPASFFPGFFSLLTALVESSRLLSLLSPTGLLLDLVVLPLLSKLDSLLPSFFPGFCSEVPPLVSVPLFFFSVAFSFSAAAGTTVIFILRPTLPLESERLDVRECLSVRLTLPVVLLPRSSLSLSDINSLWPKVTMSAS